MSLSPREEVIKVRATPAEKRRFEELAAREGLTVASLIRRRVFEHSQERPVPMGVSR